MLLFHTENSSAELKPRATAPLPVAREQYGFTVVFFYVLAVMLRVVPKG
jgi:hypothetical protein